MENRKSESSGTNVPIKDLLQMYIKHVPTGAIFQTLQDTKNEDKLFLRSKNSHKSFTHQQIQQGVVDGRWTTPNEHELRKHIREENDHMEKYTHRLVKRIIYTQLMMELDSELIEDHADDKNIRSLLERSEKHFERLVKENFNRLYNVDKEYLTNFMNGINNVVSNMAKIDVHQFLAVDKLLSDFIANPDEFTPETIELIKIDGDISNKNVVFEEVAAEQEDELHR